MPDNHSKTTQNAATFPQQKPATTAFDVYKINAQQHASGPPTSPHAATFHIPTVDAFGTLLYEPSRAASPPSPRTPFTDGLVGWPATQSIPAAPAPPPPQKDAGTRAAKPRFQPHEAKPRFQPHDALSERPRALPATPPKAAPAAPAKAAPAPPAAPVRVAPRPPGTYRHILPKPAPDSDPEA